MNSKVTTNSQLSTTEPKKKTPKKKQTKPTTRTGTESQKWRTLEGLSVGRTGWEIGGKGTGNKKHKLQVQNRQGEVKNSTENGEAKELIHMTHGHKLRGAMLEEMGYWEEVDKGEKIEQKNCNSLINKIHLKKNPKTKDTKVKPKEGRQKKIINYKVR